MDEFETDYELPDGNNYDGTFITIEGIDGSGKTSIINELEIPVDPAQGCVRTCEPSQYYTGKHTRRMIESDDTPKMADFFAFMSDRVNHNDKLIIPSLADGDIVLCDRYIDSTFAYQGKSLENILADPKGFITDITYESEIVIPDLTLLIDITPKTSVERSGADDKYEKREFIEEVQRNYHIQHIRNKRIHMIDGEQSFENVLRDCQEVINNECNSGDSTESD